MPLSFEESLTLLMNVFLEDSPGSHTACKTLISLAKTICPVEHSMRLEHQLWNANGSLTIAGRVYFFASGVISGVGVRNNPAQMCHVNAANFDDVYAIYCDTTNSQDVLAPQQTSTCTRVLLEKRSQLVSNYQAILTLRQQIKHLQTELATLTFDILSADHERFLKLKQREKTIGNLRRQTRRIERDKRKHLQEHQTE